MSAEPIDLRAGRVDDAATLASIHLRSRAAAMPWLPALHDAAQTRWWMAHDVLVRQRVVVAERGGRTVGFAALDGDRLEQLYVEPEAIGTGVGWRLLDAVKSELPAGVSLRVFSRNARARRFYEAAGFELVAERDGATNEEGEPECTYRWAGRAAGAAP